MPPRGVRKGGEGMEQERLLRLPEVLTIVGLRKSAWYDGIQKGEYPKPIKKGRSSFWPSSTIKEVVSSTISNAQ